MAVEDWGLIVGNKRIGFSVGAGTGAQELLNRSLNCFC